MDFLEPPTPEAPRTFLPRTPVYRGRGWATRGLGRPWLRFRPLVVLRQAYPAHHAPGVEVAGELVLITVARHHHDDAPLVDVFEVHGSAGPQVARENLGGLDHHLPPDPRLGYRAALRGGRSLPVHHGSLLRSLSPTAKDTPAEPGPGGLQSNPSSRRSQNL